MNWLSDKRRLIVFLSLLLLAGFTLTSVIGYRISIAAIHNEIADNQLPLTGDNIYSEIQRDLLRPVFISSVMAQDAFLRDWAIAGEANEHQVRRFLGEIKRRYKTVTSFFISEKSRAYYHPDGVQKTVSPDDPRDAWYFRVRKMASEFEINVDLDAANKDAVTIFVNYKVRDYQGNYIGATGVGLTADTVGAMIERYQERFQSRIVFVDRQGRIVMPRPAAGAPTTLADLSGMRDLAASITARPQIRATYEWDGTTHFVASRLIPELDWILVVDQSDSDAIGGLREALYLNLGISLLVTLVVMGLTLLAINIYQSRLQAMAERERGTSRRLDRMNRQKDKLLSIIGHDMRAPFNSLLGFAELLASRAPDMERKQLAEYAADILKSGRTAHGLLESLLNWTHFQWQDLNPVPEPVDLGVVISTNLDLFESTAKRKGITLGTDGTADHQVYADAHMTDLIVRNLVNNAIKFTPAGGTVTVRAEADGDLVRVTVADTGLGIAPAQQADLFKGTQHGSTAGTDGEVGIGMGLVLCREMVESNGGRIRVDSTPGQGSTFTFSLPASAPA